MHKKLLVLLLLVSSASVGVTMPRATWRQIVPAVASTHGLDGSFWRSDVTLYNSSSTAATVTVELVPRQGQAAPPPVTLASTLGPARSLTLADVVGAYFPGNTAGALVVTAKDADGQDVALAVTSRTWTPSADGSGSLGQAIPAMAWAKDGDLEDPERAVFPLASSATVRSNLGIVNPTDAVTESFVVDLRDGAGVLLASFPLELPPRTQRQLDDLPRLHAAEGDGLSATVRLVDWQDGSAGAERPDFAVYGSRIDRQSNDATYLEPQPAVTRTGAARARLVPVAASSAGSAGSHWRTDLAVHYPGDAAGVLIVIQLIPSGTGGAAGQPPFIIRTGVARGTLVIEDVLGTGFPGYSAAALEVRGIVQNQLADIRVQARTWTPAPDGNGTFGQGMAAGSMSPFSDPLAIPGIEPAGAFRTNLGIVNPSRNLRETFRVELFDADATSRGTLDLTLEPWSHLQLNQILGSDQAALAPLTAVVTLVATENTMANPEESWDPVFAAYGSKVDQVSNDPTTLPAVSLAGEPATDSGAPYDFAAETPWYVCPELPPPATTTVVTAFDQEYQYFGPEDRRSVVGEVEFPTGGDWNQIGLELLLECPESGRCDAWDRTASLQLVLNPESPREEWEYLEVLRSITPYGMGMCQYVDVTALAPVLSGHRTLESFVDTWVGPGNSSGEGWRFTYRFVFYPGEPRTPEGVVNVWGRRSITLGDPSLPLAGQVEPVAVLIPADATRVVAHLTATGHAFDNSENCAEFCPLRQDLLVDGVTRFFDPWRNDCEVNPVHPQGGTWQYDRNGWCPGAVAVGETVDITDLVTPGTESVLAFDVRRPDGSVYVNTDLGDYAPYEWVSLQLAVYTD